MRGASMMEAGGLAFYGPSMVDNFRRAAVSIDKILKGAKPAELPVEQPTKYELVVNTKTEKALGLTIPPPVHSDAVELRVLHVGYLSHQTQSAHAGV